MEDESSNVIDIDALFDSSGFGPNLTLDPLPSDRIREADFILGRDRMTGRQFVAFGTSFLKEIAESGEDREGVELVVELDQETDDLEKLFAAIRVSKGYDDTDYPGI